MPYKQYMDQSEEELNAALLLYGKEFYREAISRAYYSMFHAAQALLYLRRISPKSHKGVIQKFGEEFIKPGLLEKKMGQMLTQAESMRLKADYDVGARQSIKRNVKRYLIIAKTFLPKLKKQLKILALRDYYNTYKQKLTVVCPSCGDKGVVKI